MTTNKVAYLITYISYSCVYNDRGVIEESLLKQFLLDEVSEYIINNSCSTKFEMIDDVVKFWKRYYGHNVWEAYYVKNNEWIRATPCNEDILLNIYEMTKSTETFEEIFEGGKSLEEIVIVEKDIEGSNIEFTISSDDSFSEKSLIGEDIEIDWNTISKQEHDECNNLKD